MPGRRRRRGPITIPWWVLTAKYVLFVVLAALVAIQGLTALEHGVPRSYTPVWCIALALGAVVAAVASTSEAWETVEKWAGTWVTGWLVVILVNTITASGGRNAGWFYVLLVTLLPAGRVIHLFGRHGRRPAADFEEAP